MRGPLQTSACHCSSIKNELSCLWNNFLWIGIKYRSPQRLLLLLWHENVRCVDSASDCRNLCLCDCASAQNVFHSFRRIIIFNQHCTLSGVRNSNAIRIKMRADYRLWFVSAFEIMETVREPFRKFSTHYALTYLYQFAEVVSRQADYVSGGICFPSHLSCWCWTVLYDRP